MLFNFMSWVVYLTFVLISLILFILYVYDQLDNCIGLLHITSFLYICLGLMGFLITFAIINDVCVIFLFIKVISIFIKSSSFCIMMVLLYVILCLLLLDIVHSFSSFIPLGSLIRCHNRIYHIMFVLNFFVAEIFICKLGTFCLFY